MFHLCRTRSKSVGSPVRRAVDKWAAGVVPNNLEPEASSDKADSKMTRHKPFVADKVALEAFAALAQLEIRGPDANHFHRRNTTGRFWRQQSNTAHHHLETIGYHIAQMRLNCRQHFADVHIRKQVETQHRPMQVAIVLFVPGRAPWAHPVPALPTHSSQVGSSTSRCS